MTEVHLPSQLMTMPAGRRPLLIHEPLSNVNGMLNGGRGRLIEMKPFVLGKLWRKKNM